MRGMPKTSASRGLEPGSGSTPMGMFNPSANVSTFRARPSSRKSDRTITLSRGVWPAGAG